MFDLRSRRRAAGSTRAIPATLTAVLLLSAIASPVSAWSNGVEGPDSFGTHDWILKKAIKAAGRDASWVRVLVALRATDDPDTEDGIDHASGTWWHVYDEWGDTYGGAPEAAKVWFRRTKRRLAKGRERAASKALGYLAHIVGDVANPMHTDQRDREERIHSPYEQDVDERIDRYGFRHDGRDRALPYGRTLAVARQAHRSYFDLIRGYNRHGYNRKVHRITNRQLKRGANALADLLTALGRSR